MEKHQEQFIIDDTGNKTAVIIPLAEYEELLADLHDLAVIADRKSEATVSLQDLMKEIDGKQ